MRPETTYVFTEYGVLRTHLVFESDYQPAGYATSALPMAQMPSRLMREAVRVPRAASNRVEILSN